MSYGESDFRSCLSENIAHLAESALRFLELVQENNINAEQELSSEDAEETLHPNENYDSGTNLELSALYCRVSPGCS